MERAKILELAAAPEAVEETVCYLVGRMKGFLRKGERVLICFDDGPDSLGHVFSLAVARCGAIPMVWGQDRRWKELLRITFLHKVHTVISPPLVALGLAKLARAKATPLYIYNVVTAGYPCLDWMIDGMRSALDCRTWGCLDWKESCVVAGFSCGGSRGVHLRSDRYGLHLSEGDRGQLLLYDRRDPEDLYSLNAAGRLCKATCSCGNTEPMLTDIVPGPELDLQLIDAAQEIMRWTSVLDCRIHRGEAGLEIEIVVFPGEQLPKLPTCAKLVVRPWNPETDVPFVLQ